MASSKRAWEGELAKTEKKAKGGDA